MLNNVMRTKFGLITLRVVYKDTLFEKPPGNHWVPHNTLRYAIHDKRPMIHRFCVNRYNVRQSYNNTLRYMSNFEYKIP